MRSSAPRIPTWKRYGASCWIDVGFSIFRDRTGSSGCETTRVTPTRFRTRLRFGRTSANNQAPRRRVTRTALGLGLGGLVLIVLSPLLSVGVAQAETPTEVAEEVESDGVYVARGRDDIDEEAMAAVVQDQRFDGLRLVIVAPRDPQPTARAFARRVQEATDADIAIVFPIQGELEAYVIEDLGERKLRALTEARRLTDPVRSVETFAREITTEPEAETPAIIGQITRAVIYMAAGLLIIVLIEQLIAWFRRYRRRRRAAAATAT